MKNYLDIQLLLVLIIYKNYPLIIKCNSYKLKTQQVIILLIIIIIMLNYNYYLESIEKKNETNKNSPSKDLKKEIISIKN